MLGQCNCHIQWGVFWFLFFTIVSHVSFPSKISIVESRLLYSFFLLHSFSFMPNNVDRPKSNPDFKMCLLPIVALHTWPRSHIGTWYLWLMHTEHRPPSLVIVIVCVCRLFAIIACPQPCSTLAHAPCTPITSCFLLLSFCLTTAPPSPTNAFVFSREAGAIICKSLLPHWPNSNLFKFGTC
jgi:hypothetical protein